MSLPAIELELLRTLPSLNLRPTLEAAQTVGKLLDQARDLVPHGQWLQFLARIGLTQRTAHDYVTVHRHAGDQRPAATMTIKQFLVQVRDARRRERLAERSRVRAEVAAKKGKLDDDVVLVNADCRKFEWPKQVDAVGRRGSFPTPKSSNCGPRSRPRRTHWPRSTPTLPRLRLDDHSFVRPVLEDLLGPVVVPLQ